MDAIQAIKDRRSVRKFKDEAVERQVMEDIIEVARFAPSWINFQIARWTLIDDKEVIGKLANDAVKGFVYNMDTLKNATGVAVLSFVKGKSGKLEQYEMEDSNSGKWEIFDAGIACQTFCLAAYAKGIATCIFGVIDEDSVSAIIDLPADETVGALIVYGFEDGHPAPTKRKEVSEILRWI